MDVDPAQVKSLFLAAIDIADLNERQEFLKAQCRGNVELYRRVEALLRSNNASVIESQTSDIAGTVTGSFQNPRI